MARFPGALVARLQLPPVRGGYHRRARVKEKPPSSVGDSLRIGESGKRTDSDLRQERESLPFPGRENQPSPLTHFNFYRSDTAEKTPRDHRICQAVS